MQTLKFQDLSIPPPSLTLQPHHSLLLSSHNLLCPSLPLQPIPSSTLYLDLSAIPIPPTKPALKILSKTLRGLKNLKILRAERCGIKSVKTIKVIMKEVRKMKDLQYLEIIEDWEHTNKGDRLIQAFYQEIKKNVFLKDLVLAHGESRCVEKYKLKIIIEPDMKITLERYNICYEDSNSEDN